MAASARPGGTPRRDALRWGLCFAVIVAAHAGVALALMYTPDSPDSGFVAGNAVVMLDLPETPAAMPTQPDDMAPGPEETASEAVPQPKEETKPPEQTTDVALPDPEPPKPEPPAEERQATAPPQVMALPTEAPSTAGVDTPQPPSPAILLRWQSDLSAQLNRVKRYPPGAAARRREQGTSRITFRIDDKGQVLESRLLQSSGWTELDEEALSTPGRAQPFPKPPTGTRPEDHWIQWQITFTVPK